MQKAASYLSLTAIGVSSVEELEIRVSQKNSLAGIVFDQSMYYLPSIITYTIRFPSELRTYPSNPSIFNWMTNKLYPLFPASGPRASIEHSGGSPPGITFA